MSELPDDYRSGHDEGADWFDEWFRSDLYLKLYSHRDHVEASACVDLILRSIDFELHGRADAGVVRGALDLACGPGRHAIALAERGLAVTAVDLSPTLLEYARSEAARLGHTIRFQRADMREIGFAAEFDLVLQLFTSFGYFENRSDDALVLDRVRDALKPGGYYALDLINEQYLRRTLIPSSVKWLDGSEVREQRDIEHGRVRKCITITSPEGTERRFVERVRLYSPEDIEGMLFDARFAPVHWFGSYDGAPYDPETSERMLVISRAE